MSRLLRDAIGDTQEQYDVLLAHLSLIRDLVHVGRSAGSFRELSARLTESIVVALGYEQVAVVAGHDGDALAFTGSYSQSERFGGPPAAPPRILLALARDVMQERALVRWGGEGVGPRRALPDGIEGGVVGFPLILGDECVGAVMGVRLVSVAWDLVSQRALELVAEIIDQVMTLAQVRLSVAEVQRGLEAELGDSRSRIVRQEKTLREQSDRIGELAGSLIRTNRAKNTFLALMSHELRTPLSVILGFGSILREGLAGPVTTQQEEYLERMFSNARHLHQLVEDMLFFVDAESTRIKPAWADVELAEVVREVAGAMPTAGTPDGPTLAVAIAPDAAVVRSDRGMLKRMLFHLVGNAFKFTEHGEVRVEAVRSCGAKATEIRVIDTGTGIADDQLGRIFELFRQGDESHARKHDGVGLGLNLVRACLGLFHGRCRVVPGAHGGTRVEITLPDVVARGDGAVEVASLTPAAIAALPTPAVPRRAGGSRSPNGRAGSARG